MRSYRRLLTYAAPYWRGWLAVVAASGFGTVLSLLQPWPMQIVVDHVLGHPPLPPTLQSVLGWLPGIDSTQGLLAWVVAAGLLIFVLNSAVEVILTLGWTRFGRRMVYDLSCDLFARAQRRSLAFHTRHPVGDALSRITGDAWAVHTVVDTLLFAPGHALFTLVAIVVVMIRLDPVLTGAALLVAPFMGGAAWMFGGPIRATARNRREIESRIQSHVQQTLSGITVVQAFTREAVEQQRFEEYAGEAIRAHQRTAFVSGLHGLGSGLVATVGTSIVLWIAATRVLDGRMTIGVALVFLAYLVTLQGQLAAFAGIYATLQGAGASIDRLMPLLDDDNHVPQPAGNTRLPRVQGHVRFEQVVFGYAPGQPVLRGVTVEARPGDRIAIVGATGAGKSTLISLIPRFLDPWSGRVTIDGHDLRDVRIESVREQIALVLQDAFLFPASVAQNISIGRDGATRAEIEAAARAANAHDFIERLPEGYDTILGQRGATLSGGERQRLSIARALVRNAPILVLDEPTSALDMETEQTLLEALERLMQGRTTFIIAHRLSTIRRATRILVLADGEIVEQGTHDELLAHPGPYHRLYCAQFADAAFGPSAA